MRDDHVAELAAIRARLDAAIAAADGSAMIGFGKDLVEATAKVVLAERSVSFGDQTKGNELVTKALGALDLPTRLINEGDPDVAQLVEGLEQAGRAVFRLRNRLGTGHGRTHTPDVDSDLAELAARADRIWSDWAIQRLDRLQLGDVDLLIADLTSSIFRAGDLTRRFADVRLQSLDDRDQLRLGVAVAHRARRQTIVVHREGVQAAVESPSSLPKAYRAGVVEGLVVNDEGQLHPMLLSDLATLVGSIDKDDWEAIVDEGRDAPWSHALSADSTVRSTISETMTQLTESLPAAMRPGWTELMRFSTWDDVF